MASMIEFALAGAGNPGGLWSNIIFWVNGGVFNLGWAIVLVTLMVKLVMFPLDFWMKLSSKKNTLVQKKLAPQIAAINKKYANNRNIANMQVASLYKKEGLNMLSSCVFTLIYLIFSLVVFFTFFSAMRNVSVTRTVNQYQQVKEVYFQTLGEESSTERIKLAEQAAEKEWKKNKDSWLWISNIWRPDTYKSSVHSFDELKKTVKNDGDKNVKAAFAEINKAEYNQVMAGMISENSKGWNGFFVLAALAAGLSFLSQWIAELGNKIKRKKGQNQPLSSVNKPGLPGKIAAENAILPEQQAVMGAGNPANSSTMKIMKFLLPAVMVIFVLTSSAAFGLYIVTGSLFSVGSSFVTNLIVSRLTQKKEEEVALALEKQEKKQSKHYRGVAK